MCAILRKLALVSLVAVLVPVARAEWLPDYAPNGSFEVDANRDQRPDGWVPATFDSPAQTEWDLNVAHSGRASVRVDDSAHATDDSWHANSGRWVQAGRRNATAGAEYTLTGWIKSDLTEGAATITLAWSAGGEWLHEDSAPLVTGRSDWTFRTITATAPERANSVAVYLIVQGAKGSAWFDDVAMVQGDGTRGPRQPVDISAACNTGFADNVAGDGRGGWTDQGDNDARSLPVGRQSWRSVPFEIVDPAANAGRSCIVLKGRGRQDAPVSAAFDVGRTCDVVYFLHGCAWAPDGSLVGRYVITYADGDEVEVPLRNGSEIVDWWQPRDTPESAVGWEGANPQNANVGLSIFPWVNPRSQVAVARIELRSTGEGPVPILAAVTTGSGPPILSERVLQMETTDTDGWYEWAFALDDPTMGELDLSYLLDGPAGKHGFLTVRDDGHFYFEDGTRARFFGTNVGGPNCSPDRQQAEMVAQRLASHGVNMLRLHAFDGTWGRMIDYEQDDSQHFDPEAFDRFDYFVAQLKQRGVYVYFDLLDYRAFQPGDGVREADDMGVMWSNSVKGASIFDRRMIELQKDYATQLLTHMNPYTGNRYVDEPAVAVLEITNENSLFYLGNPKLILPSYLNDLAGLWNDWLVERFGDRAGLAAGWTNADGECALLADEDPAKGTVLFPVGRIYDDVREAPYVGERSPARLNAIIRFLYETELAYYDEMIGHVRGLGMKCPITGTNQDFSDAGTLANTRCDFMSRNNYWCHPDVNAKPHMRFDNSAAVNSDIARRANPVACVAASTVVGKPIISPEFNFPWPNEWRAECLPLMAAYGRLQDWDGLLYFAYDPGGVPLSSFGNQSDPVRWGQVPMAALMFLREDVAVARSTVDVGFSTVDALAARPYRFDDRYSPWRVLPYISKTRSAFFGEAYEGDADVVVSSGHSAAGDYSRARRAIVFADSSFADEAGRARDRGSSARATSPGLRTRPAQGGYDTEVLPGSVPEGADVIRRGEQAVGSVSDTRYVFPNASADEPGGGAWLHRLYLDAANRWGLPGAAPVAEAGKVFRSDTGELVLDRGSGVFTAVAPRARVATGFLGAEGPIELGSATIECRTAFASVSIVSLDARPVGESERLLVTAVARAENTGQAYMSDHSVIPEFGRAPVVAEPVDAEITIAGPGGLRAFALTPNGARGAELPIETIEGGVLLKTAAARSPWILLVR